VTSVPEAHKKGLIPDRSAQKMIVTKEADALSGHVSILWGTNAALHSSRANTLLAGNHRIYH